MTNEEQDLLARLRRGDTDAVGEAFTRHGRMVFNVCCRVLHDHAAAEDALQETFLLLQRKAPEFNDRTVLVAWLYRAGELEAREALRSTSRRGRRERTVAEAAEQTAEVGAANQDMWEQICPQLDRILAGLPERLRAPIILTQLEGKSVREAAGILNVPEGTIKSRVSRGLDTLRQQLAPATASLSAAALAAMLAQHANEFAVPPNALSALLHGAQAQAPSLKARPKPKPRGGSGSGMRWVAIAAPLLLGLGLYFHSLSATPTPAPTPVAPTTTAATPVPVVQSHTFYVSPAGNDGSDGATAEHAWKSVAKVNATAFKPGDQILFQRGGEWREALAASSDGAAERPIVYGAYGTGAKPKFWGSEVLKNDQFKADGQDIYSYAIPQTVGAVLINHALNADGLWLVHVDAPQLDTVPDSFDYANGKLRIHSALDPRSTGAVFTVCVRDNLINSKGKSHLVFQDLVTDESAVYEGDGIRIDGGADVLVDRCETYRAGGRHVAAVNVDRFVGRDLRAAYARPDPQQSHFFVSYCDLPGAHVAQSWLNCTGEHCENPTHLEHIVLVTSGPGLGVITIQNLSALGGMVSLGHNLSATWNTAKEPYAIDYRGGRIDNAPLQVFASHLLIDGVTITGDNGCIDLFGSDNIVQNAQVLNINPKNGGTTGYCTAIVCRKEALRNTLRFCTVVVAKDADDRANCLTLGGPATMTQWYGNIFSSPRLVMNVEGVADAQGVAFADYNFYNLTAEFTGSRLTFDQWRQNFSHDQHSLAGNPLFAALEAGSGRVKPSSPALHAVDMPQKLRIPLDLSGHPRTGSRCDLGANAQN